MNTLESLGYNDWIHDQLDLDKKAAHEVARVIAVHKDSYVVSKGCGEAFAECSGNLLYSVDSPVDLPTTGDWVYADFYDDDSHAIVRELTFSLSQPMSTLLLFSNL